MSEESNNSVQPTPTVVDIVLPLIKYYEQCQLSPYLDEAGVATIGWGNTYYQDGTKVTINDQPLSQEEADALLEHILQGFVTDVTRMCQGQGTPNELAAFVDLAYNVGDTNFGNSSALKFFLAGNKPSVGHGIELWTLAGGKPLKGLQRRRRAERLVFYGTAPAFAIAQAESDFP